MKGRGETRTRYDRSIWRACRLPSQSPRVPRVRPKARLRRSWATLTSLNRTLSAYVQEPSRDCDLQLCDEVQNTRKQGGKSEKHLIIHSQESASAGISFILRSYLVQRGIKATKQSPEQGEGGQGGEEGIQGCCDAGDDPGDKVCNVAVGLTSHKARERRARLNASE
jgi:hypothetical protein